MALQKHPLVHWSMKSDWNKPKYSIIWEFCGIHSNLLSSVLASILWLIRELCVGQYVYNCTELYRISVVLHLEYTKFHLLNTCLKNFSNLFLFPWHFSISLFFFAYFSSSSSFLFNTKQKHTQHIHFNGILAKSLRTTIPARRREQKKKKMICTRMNCLIVTGFCLLLNEESKQVVHHPSAWMIQYVYVN